MKNETVVWAVPREAVGAVAVTSVAKVGLVKGQPVTLNHCRQLEEHGIEAIEVVFYSQDSISEDQAARAVSALIDQDCFERREKVGGRVDFVAVDKGRLFYDRQRLWLFNQQCEQISLACLKTGWDVQAGQTVATLKVNPFAVAPSTVDEAKRLIAPVSLRIAQRQLLRIQLIDTSQSSKSLRKLTQAMTQRCERLGAIFCSPITCSVEDLASVLQSIQPAGCDLLLLSAGRSLYSLNEPLALAVANAGQVIRHGLPIEPGNLLLVGALTNGIPVIGLSRCCYSPAPSALDQLCEHCAFGQNLSLSWLADLGCGGYLKNAD